MSVRNKENWEIFNIKGNIFEYMYNSQFNECIPFLKYMWLNLIIDKV